MERPIIHTYSEALQDVFAYLVNGNTSTYIELGANNATTNNTTYALETHYGWSGISVEMDTSHAPSWQANRKNKIYWTDATTFDYLAAVKENNLPTRLGFLSADIDPPSNTYAALQHILGQGLSFNCITFEHDKYAGHTVDYDALGHALLTSYGYKVAVTGVYHKEQKHVLFETWYVHSDVDFPEQTFEEFRAKL